MLFRSMIPPQIDNFSAYLIGVIAAFLTMYVEDRKNIYQKIFLAITFFSIRWLTVAMADRFDDLVTKALVFRNMDAEKVWLQYGLYVGTRVLDLVLCIAFIAIAIGLINKAYIYKKDEMSVKEMVMLIVPSLVGVTGYGILQYYLMIYERDTGDVYKRQILRSMLISKKQEKPSEGISTPITLKEAISPLGTNDLPRYTIR